MNIYTINYDKRQITYFIDLPNDAHNFLCRVGNNDTTPNNKVWYIVERFDINLVNQHILGLINKHE